jgi:hypothetical protein
MDGGTIAIIAVVFLCACLVSCFLSAGAYVYTNSEESSTSSSKAAPVQTARAIIPSNLSQGYNSGGLSPFPANGPNAFAYKIGPTDKVGQLIVRTSPTKPGYVYKVNMLIGDLRIFNPTQPANKGNITIVPWGGGQFLEDDLKTPSKEQSITVPPSLYWSDITFNISYAETYYVYFMFYTSPGDTVAIQKLTLKRVSP